ncbi:MAG: tRNA (guanosine(46)-N7)-methyltransferase TrmB [Sedimentisphaerales bacterium]|nr:tRNA (guanosine(46)-N7)-methyltransferase TrmB [Sedimentisphaerales bacterium]
MSRILKDYPSVSLKAEDLVGTLDFGDIFGREGPVHIEIGSGKGTFLVSQAGNFGDINFLGIEWARKYYRYAVDRIGRWGLDNVRIIRTDAASFIAEFLGDESVECFHIYFPDPWPKKRHHKRRFLCAGNFEQLLRCLKVGGEIRIATDHAEYFEAIQETIVRFGDRVEEIALPATAGAIEGEITGTNYERKYIKDERSINTIAVRKIR